MIDQLKKLFDQKRSEILDRFRYRKPTPAQVIALEELHQQVIGIASWMVDYLPDSRDRAVALTSLEDFRMKANKSIVFADLKLTTDNNE